MIMLDGFEKIATHEALPSQNTTQSYNRDDQFVAVASDGAFMLNQTNEINKEVYCIVNGEAVTDPDEALNIYRIST